MCGIVGFTAPTDGELLGRMLQRIVHRGPDDEGCFIEDRIAIGHRRLAIIDRAGGKQPMSTADGRYVIAFNGEIYNFIELRQRLESKGEVFRTHSDTEVLLSWIVRRGIEGLPALNGMFALALWDREKGRLLLARDRLGMKPMYLHEGPGGRLSFASEIKALLPVIGPERARARLAGRTD